MATKLKSWSIPQLNASYNNLSIKCDFFSVNNLEYTKKCLNKIWERFQANMIENFQVKRK